MSDYMNFDDAGELLERLLAPAHPANRLDDPVAELEDRLDVEKRPGQRLRLPDPPALLQVLERRGREHDPVRASEALDELVELRVRGAARQPAVDRLGEQGACERRRIRVDDTHDVAAELLRRPPRRLAGA